MNKNLTRLCNIGSKESRIIIGLMSGTSLDGLDIAVCSFMGSGQHTKVDILQFQTVSYDISFKEEIRAIFSKETIDFQKLCLLNGWVAKVHAAMILDSLEKWEILPETIDLIASHGQTVYHAPKLLHKQEKFGNATLQIGDGDQLAVSTGIITISDFRQKHIAAGGEGAPLAVYGDYLIFSKKGEDRIMLNIGGIANFTFLPGDLDFTKIFSTDTGPGNTLMDAYVQQNFQIAYDMDAAIASAGTVSEKLLSELVKHSFFEKGFPKTTGPELFNLSYLEEAIIQAGVGNISKPDVMATLNRFSAVTIVNTLEKSFDKKGKFTIYTI
jgi:anhydro-N-acetylmuramic acid kinase